MVVTHDPDRRGGKLIALQAVHARKDPKHGGILFDLRSVLGYQVWLGRWSEGLPLERWLGDTRQPLDAPVRLAFLSAPGSLHSTHPLLAWRADAPTRGLAYAARGSWQQLQVLRAIQMAPRTLDRVEQSPVLYWLAAVEAGASGASPEDVRELFGWRRRDLAEWCGGVNSNACVRAIEKFPLPTSAWDIARIKRIIGDAEVLDLGARVTHVQDFASLRSLRDHAPEVLGLRAVRTESNAATRTVGPGTAARSVEDILRLGGVLERDVSSSIDGCRDAEALQSLHDRLVLELYDLDPTRLSSRSGAHAFQRPPVAGTELIEPITTLEQLVAEGRLMRHCCASYVFDVQQKRTYFYRVLAPQRATLAVDIAKGRRAVVAELKLKDNQEPSLETCAAVRAWLKAAQAQH